MRIKILCQNRVGILRDMLNLLVDYGINVARGEVGGEQGNAVYLHCPNLMNLQLQALRPKIEALPGVFELRKVSLMRSDAIKTLDLAPTAHAAFVSHALQKVGAALGIDVNGSQSSEASK